MSIEELLEFMGNMNCSVATIISDEILQFHQNSAKTTLSYIREGGGAGEGF